MLGRRFIRDYMPDQHRESSRSCPFVVLGAVRLTGAVWTATCGRAAGLPGFAATAPP